jgi:hypothetical protein
MADEKYTPKPASIDNVAPEWASRFLPIPEFAAIVGEKAARSLTVPALGQSKRLYCINSRVFEGDNDG